MALRNSTALHSACLLSIPTSRTPTPLLGRPPPQSQVRTTISATLNPPPSKRTMSPCPMIASCACEGTAVL
ncbi:hypothetical protein P171DRAFT_114822 [Karstenula rhodostoma CBS 690.94]|uniref:Uncharacterized protein n=1 Tax=Karstenula rhodostoma CBS 690.94 TaxID=1392251 RepID=A0A9P4PB31_9PLEO|nr:hypothetical protein P171DRAFT_114822 [Karstenula rhodostoma CBS 690.94]